MGKHQKTTGPQEENMGFEGDYFHSERDMERKAVRDGEQQPYRRPAPQNRDRQHPPVASRSMTKMRGDVRFGGGGHEAEYVLHIADYGTRDSIPADIFQRIAEALPNWCVVNRGSRIEISSNFFMSSMTWLPTVPSWPSAFSKGLCSAAPRNSRNSATHWQHDLLLP
jgi:hypothetical protein